MKITFLGTSHGYCEKGHFCSSAAVTVGERSYLIDAGAPIMGLLVNHDIPYTSLGGIFITHSHQDHYMGLVEFIGQIEDFERYKDVDVTVHVPPEFPSGQINTFLFGNPEGKFRPVPGGCRKDPNDMRRRVNFVTYPDGVIFDDGNVKITAIPVSHCPHAHSFLFEAEGKKILFSGDLQTDFTDYPAVLTEGDGVDLLIIEAAHSKLDKPENVELFKKTKTKHMIVSHRNPLLNTDEVVGKVIDAVDYPVDFAFDGRVVEL